MPVSFGLDILLSLVFIDVGSLGTIKVLLMKSQPCATILRRIILYVICLPIYTML
jgi:hypothetical protein